jgi:hypothetical protein
MVLPALRRLLRETAFPFVRIYLRYCPLRIGKIAVFHRVAEPYFFMRPHEFTASMVHGMKVRGNAGDYIQSWIYFFGIFEPNLT